MKFGIRKPNLKSSVKARTTGRVKRAAKRAVNPVYGKKGTGWITNPKKAAYNAVYHRTSVGVPDIVNGAVPAGKRSATQKTKTYNTKPTTTATNDEESSSHVGCIFVFFGMMVLGVILVASAAAGVL